jgi:hypothetical protein
MPINKNGSAQMKSQSIFESSNNPLPISMSETSVDPKIPRSRPSKLNGNLLSINLDIGMLNEPLLSEEDIGSAIAQSRKDSVAKVVKPLNDIVPWEYQNYEEEVAQARAVSVTTISNTAAQSSSKFRKLSKLATVSSAASESASPLTPFRMFFSQRITVSEKDKSTSPSTGSPTSIEESPSDKYLSPSPMSPVQSGASNGSLRPSLLGSFTIHPKENTLLSVFAQFNCSAVFECTTYMTPDMQST